MWESYCASKGIKSVIGNYKDNRFNGLFETSAAIIYHRNDFIHILQTVDKPNLKIQSVKADLLSPTILSMLTVIAILHVQITGPYWMLVTSGVVSYLELYPHIQALETYLEGCAQCPEKMLQGESWIVDIEIERVRHCEKYSQVINAHCLSPLEAKLLTVCCQAMLQTVRKQLSDFLFGGRYSTAPTKEDMARTGYAQVTNLGCEHHFGDLDSSQKRRPNASIHHHSSVQLLKRNGKRVITWLKEMEEEERTDLLKRARKGGKELRQRHLEQQRQVVRDVLEASEKSSKKKNTPS